MSVHAIGDRIGKTFCGSAANERTQLAAVEGDITCDRCLDLLSYRRIGIRTGTFQSKEDAKLDRELGVHRPPTQGT